jgi:hypothetical protein
MSFPPHEEEENRGESNERTNGEDYEVGFGKPPREYQFKKGQSGNPRGRPRKPKLVKKQDPLGFGTQPANQYLLEEAYRPVMVREGDQVIRIPTIQAVFRAMGVRAMKGDRFAQRMIAELVGRVEADDRKARLDHLQAMIDYKCDWDLEIERARKSGCAEPQPIPHPDDVIIDFLNAHATVCGPMTKEEKTRWDRLLEYRDDVQTEVSTAAQAFREATTPERKASALKAWIFEQKFYDRINDNLPRRYRKELEDRCWDSNASRPGSQRTRTWPGD